MYAYDTLSEAITALKLRGFTEDFNLLADSIRCTGNAANLRPEDFAIVEVYRFEGMSNPDDSSILYVIESNDGLKGTLVDAYGIYSENMSEEMIQKLRVLH